MSDWIDWDKHPVPDDVKGVFIKYEDGFVETDRYFCETKERKYRDSKVVAWRFIDRRGKDENSVFSNIDVGS